MQKLFVVRVIRYRGPIYDKTNRCSVIESHMLAHLYTHVLI